MYLYIYKKFELNIEIYKMHIVWKKNTKNSKYNALWYLKNKTNLYLNSIFFIHVHKNVCILYKHF